MSIVRLATAVMMIGLSMVGTSSVSFGFAPVLSPPAPRDDDVRPIACRRGWQKTTNYVYAPKRFGRCPAGYVVPGGIAGSRCMKSVDTCIPIPHCGTRVC